MTELPVVERHFSESKPAKKNQGPPLLRGLHVRLPTIQLIQLLSGSLFPQILGSQALLQGRGLGGKVVPISLFAVLGSLIVK